MLAAFLLACADAFAPRQRRALVTGLLLALLVLVALWLGVTLLLHEERFFAAGWIETPVEILGSLAALALAWLIFPATATLILGFFLEGVIADLERQHYPGLPPARAVPWREMMGSALRLFILSILGNLVVLLFWFAPGINLFIYYGLNGYLLGREYFDLVALRRMDGAAARAMWRWHRGRLVAAGIVISVMLSLPLVNLAAPLIAAAFMLHVFEGLRRRRPDRSVGNDR